MGVKELKGHDSKLAFQCFGKPEIASIQDKNGKISL